MSNHAQNTDLNQPLSSIHHSFDVELAARYGIEEALIIHHFQHWIAYNKRTGKNLIDGKTWVFQTIEEIAAHFQYLTFDKVKYTVKILIQKGILTKAFHDKNHFNRTYYYAFVDEDYFIPKNVYERENSTMGSGKFHNQNRENSTMYMDKILKKDTYINIKAAPPVHMFISGNVKMTTEAHEKLKAECGEQIVEEMIKRLQEYSLMKAKKFAEYTDHAAVIRNWIRKDKENPKANSNGTHPDEKLNRDLALKKEKELLKAGGAGYTSYTPGINGVEIFRSPNKYSVSYAMSHEEFKKKCGW